MSGLPLEVVQIAVEMLTSITASRYCIASAYSVVVYDWLTSLDQEIAYISKARWSPVKGAYIFCRYWTLIVVPFLVWGCIFDHNMETCQKYVHALYASLPPITISAQFILMMRAYAFCGRRRSVFVVLSTGLLFLTAVYIWVMAREMQLVEVFFFFFSRTGCFAESDQSTQYSYVGSWHLALMLIASVVFDFLNIFFIARHYIKERGTIGPLAQTFINQGLVVYLVMTIMNVFTMGTFFSSNTKVSGAGSWHALYLPSPLACRLVLMLRKKAMPTDTELLVQYSQMVDEALEMIPVEHGAHPNHGVDGDAA
ncbi:hypothetical protein BV25DRAFT_1921699 [Artomyces pyxidatus]|uniref:Uncharacterized protein n=1 Tax=Artomyces pyxidatus TaxID=48021 RepID=A0ACB8SIA6_9AGAM|nr:hypothetical protein BV25DRAFT_1921699 [Artomyces pyxidatus]